MLNFKKLKKTFIIAEVGNNHEGSFKNAIKLIYKAKECGVDAVKFQTFQAELFINKNEKDRFKKLKSFELTKNNFKKLSIHAKKLGLKFISTPLDIPSAKYLSNLVDVFKISSGDNNFFELIKICAGYKKPLIISTGMLNTLKIMKILSFLNKIKFPQNKLAFLHCVSDYPVADNEANLLSISHLKKKLPTTIGYSDHVIALETCLASVTLGAKILEKHFTLDNNFSNFRDHKLSLNPNQMKKMVESVRKIETMLGKNEKEISKSEKKNLVSMRRSIFFSENLKKGTVLKKKHLKIVRPFKFVEPNNLSKLLGKKLKKNVSESQPVSYNLIS